MTWQIRFRRGTTAEWTASNPILAAGEPGIDTTLKIFKIGDGVTAWGSLPQQSSITGTGIPAGGTVGQVLVKQSSGSGDVAWETISTGGGGGGTISYPQPSPNHDYTIYRDGTSNTYVAVSRLGVALAFSDETGPVVSGLKGAITSCAGDGISIYFPPGIYEFPEEATGDQDHWAPNGLQDMTLEGAGRSTIISNWRDDTQSGYDTNADTEPFSFTRCHGLTWRNMTVWAGGNIDSNNSSDALDFDGCANILVENIYIERSRARGIVYDGGDDGAISNSSTIRGLTIQGVPMKPALYKGTATTGFVAQEYRYCVTYVDSVLGETPPSEVGSITPTGTTIKNRIWLSRGPLYKGTKGVTARKIYRWSTAQPTWHLLTTISDNTTEEYDDSATDASIAAGAAPPTTAEPLIPAEGIKLLGSKRHTVEGNVVFGVGSHGIQVVRKGSDVASKHSSWHKVIGNTIRQSGHGSPLGSVAGIYVGGGSGNIVEGNTIINSGTVANLGMGIYVQGLGGEVTDNNIIVSNHIADDQDANSPSGGKSTRYGIQVNSVGTGTTIPDSTVIAGNSFQGLQTGNINIIAGTNVKQYALADHVHPAAPGGPAPVTMNWKSGLYYGARTVLAHSSVSGQVLTADQIFASPIYVPQDITVTTIACNVSATGGGTKLRMGLYLMGGTGRPTTLISGSETGDLTVTNGLKVATISAALTGGTWIWGVVITDGAPALTGFSGGQPNIVGSIDPSSGTKQSALRVALGTGWTALPSTFPGAPSETAITVNVEVKF